MARILGIDIGEDHVRATLVRSSFRKIEILEYIEAEISLTPNLPVVPALGAPGEPPFVPEEAGAGIAGIAPIADEVAPEAEAEEAEEAEEKSALALTVEGLIASIRPAPEGIIVGLDGRDASIRTMEVPSAAIKKLDELLPFQLEELVPFEIDETVIDHQPMEIGNGMVKILAAAAPKERVGRYIAEMRAIGIDPREIAVGAAALDGLVEIVPELATPGPHLVMEVADERTDLCIVENGVCVLSRTLSGGLDLVKRQRAPALASQIKRTLSGWRASGGRAAQQVFLTGEGVLSPNAVSWIADVTSLRTVPLPLPNVEGVSEERRPAFGRAAALASRVARKQRRLDLRKGEFATQRAMGELRRHMKLFAMCAAVVLFAFGFSTYARWSVLTEERDELREQLATVTESAFGNETRSPRQARELLSGGSATEDPLPRFDAYHALDVISQNIPTEITHNTRRLEIEIDDEARDGHFELQGTVASIAERDTIAAQLESHECFHDISRGPTSPGPGGEGLNYRLEVDIRCPGAPEPPTNNRSKNRRSGTRR